MNKFLKVGSDPEAFLRDKNGLLVSSIDIRLPGTKANPFKTLHGSIQQDNVLAEFNSIPADNLSDFIKNHKLIIDDLKDILKPLDLQLDFIASALCPSEMLVHPQARMVGCSPDYNVWTGKANRRADYDGNDIRAAGGHVHISFDQAVNNNEARHQMVQALDLVLCLPSVLLDPDTDRRKFYGKAGSFRPKDAQKERRPDPYDGIEYRSLSNFWLKDEGFMTFVWDGIEKCYNNLKELSDMAIYHKDRLIQIINSSDTLGAEKLMGEVGIYDFL